MQAGRQAGRQALGMHSVGAMPWRGLFFKAMLMANLCINSLHLAMPFLLRESMNDILSHWSFYSFKFSTKEFRKHKNCTENHKTET